LHKILGREVNSSSLREEKKIGPELVGHEVLLSTLAIGQEFESNGTLYRLKPKGRCALLETPLKVEKYLITIPGDTLVKTV